MLVLRIIGASLLAYIVSLAFGFGNVTWFALFPASGGFFSTVLFFFALSIVAPISYGLVGLLGNVFSKLTRGKWYVAIFPILIYIWHCIADIDTLFTTQKLNGFEVSNLYYVRSTVMSLYYIALYFGLSSILFLKEDKD